MSRAGTFIKQPLGYTAFIPKPLPPDPPLALDNKLLQLLSHADQELGRLDGSTEVLPNPDLFVAMFVRQEALLSSQIEGTQASLVDVLQFEADAIPENPDDVGEVVNYIRAMDFGLERLKELPLSLRLLREIHQELLKSGRGAERHPGEFRTSQNWIGGKSVSLQNASFVPPPPTDMLQAMDALERFFHDPTPMPVLLKCGLIHAQFETIHPFLDGNGRMGRLLITFFLVWQRAMRRPLLYLSVYLKQHRDAYYDALQRVREYGDWEGWIEFYLRGIAESARSATTTACAIMRLREELRELVGKQRKGSVNGLRLVDNLFKMPVVSAKTVERMLEVSYPTASSLVDHFVGLGILRQTTPSQRNRRFIYDAYVNLFISDKQDEQNSSSDQTRNNTAHTST